MSSARERFKKANNFVHLGSEGNKETIVDEIVNGLEETPKKSQKKTEPSEIKEVKTSSPKEKQEPTQKKETPVAKTLEMPKTEEVYVQHVINPVGRPRVYDGGYHNYAARLRNDVHEYIQTIVGKDKPYKSVNEYLNYLVLKDMQNSAN